MEFPILIILLLNNLFHRIAGLTHLILHEPCNFLFLTLGEKHAKDQEKACIIRPILLHN